MIENREREREVDRNRDGDRKTNVKKYMDRQSHKLTDIFDCLFDYILKREAMRLIDKER